VLHYDYAQKIMVNRIEAVPVMSEISNFIRKFNQGEVDIVAAPAYAFKPLELEKGLGNKGTIHPEQTNPAAWRDLYIDIGDNQLVTITNIGMFQLQ
jgi:hypothetical protein